MVKRVDGYPQDGLESMPQRGLLLAQLADVYNFARERDSENRVGNYTGEQFLYHNAQEVTEPITARMEFEPVGHDNLLHGVRELSMFIPEDEQFWSGGLPLFCFAKVKAQNDRIFVYGVTDQEVEEYTYDDQLFAKWEFDERETAYKLVLGSNKLKDKVVDGWGEIGEPLLTPERESYLDRLVGALSECVHEYGLRSQRHDTSIK